MSNRTIRLVDVESILPQTLLIHLGPSSTDWDIVQIDIHDESGALIVDDLRFESLPPASQMRLLGYLNEHQHSLETRRRTLARSLEQLSLDGAFT